ncbi:hypothetical protein EUBVEN_02426 [Eubacterium ventriosum ATCC 27560]|uniref:Uncharacterized protein n=1 Tax=Eubacterium ventriosum ATCC 27560 TaxID=411463 RepID=A5Z9N0_9FIRM|nr:hypothetical protein EUBVEN_02426 [Eubacterium ventriosum ATCC 27560]
MVFYFRIPNTGIKICYVLGFQCFLQSFVKFLAIAFSPCILI